MGVFPEEYRVSVCSNGKGCGNSVKPGVLQSMGLKSTGHDWATEQQWLHTTVTLTVVVPALVVFSSLRPGGLQHARLPCPSPSSWTLPKLMSVESVMPSNHIILCRPLLLLPSVFPSIRVFSKESALHIRWPKYWSFSFCISPSNEHSGLWM